MPQSRIKKKNQHLKKKELYLHKPASKGACVVLLSGVLTTTTGLSLNIQVPKVTASTTTSQQKFIETIAETAKSVADANDLYPSVMIAQSILESNWGQSSLSKAPYYNLFGIQGSYQGKNISMTTQEYIDSNYVTIKKTFRQYPSHEESFQDNANVLKTTNFGSGFFYRAAWRSNASTYQQATAALTGKYATSPIYGQTLNKLISEYNLTRFDDTNTSSNTSSPNSNMVTTTPTETYIVKSGDTLWDISQKKKVTVQQIKNWNNLTKDTIYVDQKLELFETNKTQVQQTAVYRIYNTETKEHFYTTSLDEINGLVNADPAWIKEGVAFQAPAESNTPVYRLINIKSSEHFFTADNTLANKMITENSKDGWQNDTSLTAYQHDTASKTIAFYSADATAENTPVLNLYNAEAGIGQHFYTTSSTEADIAKSQFSWKEYGSFDKKDGVAWYALGQSTSNDSTTTIIQKTASNFPIPNVPSDWTITSPIDTTNYSSDTYDFRQCTWFAWNRANQLGIAYSPYMGNGQDWQNNAGYKVTSTPTVHSVVSFKAGQFGFSNQYGHVAFVEAVHPDGSILVSESGLGYSSLYVYQVFTAEEAAQLHYVIGK